MNLDLLRNRFPSLYHFLFLNTFDLCSRLLIPARGMFGGCGRHIKSVVICRTHQKVNSCTHSKKSGFFQVSKVVNLKQFTLFLSVYTVNGFMFFQSAPFPFLVSTLLFFLCFSFALDLLQHVDLPIITRCEGTRRRKKMHEIKSKHILDFLMPS